MTERIFWQSPFPLMRYAENLSKEEQDRLLEANIWERGVSLHPPAASIPLAPLSGSHHNDKDG